MVATGISQFTQLRAVARITTEISRGSSIIWLVLEKKRKLN